MAKPLSAAERTYVAVRRAGKDPELAYRSAWPAAKKKSRDRYTIAERAERVERRPHVVAALVGDDPAVPARDGVAVDLDSLTDDDDMQHIRRTLREIVRDAKHKDRMRALEMQQRIIEQTDQSDPDAKLFRALGPESGRRLLVAMRERWPELA